MVSITVEASPAQLRRISQELADIPGGANKAVAAAINRTLSTGKMRMSSLVREVLVMRKKDVDPSIKIDRAKPDKLTAQVSLRNTWIPLSRFSPKQQGKGVTVNWRKGRGRELLAGTFLATMSSGHIGVFRRRKSGTKRVIKEREGHKWTSELPIDQQFTTLVNPIEKRPELIDKATADIDQVLAKNLDSQVDRLLQRKKL